jgi:NADH-quinone oxidoreductase subunit M
VSWISDGILTLAIFLPLVGAAAICFVSASNPGEVRRLALSSSLVTLIIVLVAAGMFLAGPAAGSGTYALEKDVTWIGGGSGPLAKLDVRYHVGLDGVSVWLFVLTGLLTPLSVWASFSAIREQVKLYYILMLLLHTGMLGVFCAMDLLLFYVFFEFTLVPLFFLIGIWGGKEKRRAAHRFFLYTFAGSVLTFSSILYLAWHGYANADAMTPDAIRAVLIRQMPADADPGQIERLVSSIAQPRFSFDMQRLYMQAQLGLIPPNVQWWAFLGMIIGFAVKVPLFPLHTWLPLAHTEAPTAGSVILAGVLLKLGTYGLMRFAMPMFPSAAMAFGPFMGILAIAGIIYGALAAWVQDDVKKLVAYSSVSHLGFCVLGMFSLKAAGLTGSLIYMVNHGLSTGALFLVVGMIYERYHTRQFSDLSGLARRMPILAFFLIVFTLSSVGLPGLNGFVGEFLVLLGTFTSAGEPNPGPFGIPYAAVAATGIILSAVYMFWMCQRVLFGPVVEPPHTPDTSHGLKQDLTGREIGVLAPIAVLCLIIGVWPASVTTSMRPALERQILSRVLPGTAPEAARIDKRELIPGWPTASAVGARLEKESRVERRMGHLPHLFRSRFSVAACGPFPPHAAKLSTASRKLGAEIAVCRAEPSSARSTDAGKGWDGELTGPRTARLGQNSTPHLWGTVPSVTTDGSDDPSYSAGLLLQAGGTSAPPQVN